MDVFFSDADRAEYLKEMSEQGRRFGVEYIAWCLMTNHVHLIAVPEEEGRRGLPRHCTESDGRPQRTWQPISTPTRS
jgi:hypothetical protein